ncbi:PucR family transcriptional regulator [Paenibacillus paeoniae]|uniref:PucR family transcriptional regulator n=1 Tax=Paenibacillus paeoniae TaxID=2292705 RepID=A0A371PDX1_9BACL|nr:helix-turn-helix domain-containing protein [Paenibacillus paeoniae]REK74131.1 PucR family transcriptional regulator [Paenibacillus paeoniae]
MSTYEWLKPLEKIMNRPLTVMTIKVPEWKEIADRAETVSVESPDEAVSVGAWIEHDRKLWMVAESNEKQLAVLEMEALDLDLKDKELMGWSLRHAANGLKSGSEQGASESEKLAFKLGEWLQKQLEAEEPVYSLPDLMTVGSRLYHDMIPFLLVAEQSSVKQDVYPELEKLLRSFLSDDILLIPLKSREWLIWGPLSLLKDEDAEMLEHAEEETMEDSLASIAIGLHEMLASEWLGECHLAVTHPISPAKGMVEAAIMLRETIHLGRKFHIGTNIHLPWMLQLERLLNAIPESNRSKYLEQSLKRADLFVEAEMLSTLETFFSLDCNVSETAKKLYIHRNTLLYRLDKLKQETGLDVRQFRDAVLVKIILLLYKVTKRN